MDDTISRQAAIDATTETVFVEYEENADKEESIIRQTKAAIRDRIKALPPVQPKRGKWIDAVIPNDNGDLLVQVCDQCNTFFPLAYTGGGHHFCPNCGADMRCSENPNS